MSFFHDAHMLYEGPVYLGARGSHNKTTINPYFEEFLDSKDSEFIRGFDFVAEQTIKSFFTNLEEYSFELASAGIDVSNIDSEEMLSDTEYVGHNKDMYIADIFKRCLLDYVEHKRNEWITSAIDRMSDEDYRKVRAEYFDRNGLTDPEYMPGV